MWLKRISMIGMVLLLVVILFAHGTNVYAATDLTAPSNFRVTNVGDSTISWAWDSVPNVYRYVVKTSLTSGGPYADSQLSTYPATTAVDVINGFKYYCVVVAQYLDGSTVVESAPSNEVTAIPMIPNPDGLTATAADGQINLGWYHRYLDTASNCGSQYLVKRSSSPGGYYETIPNAEISVDWAVNDEMDSTYIQSHISYADKNVVPGATYYYVVSAMSTSGYFETGNSNEAYATAIASSKPAAPTGLTATSGNGQINLAWNASSTATSYNVKRGSTTGSYTTIANVSGTSFTDTTVTNGTTYHYIVTAVNANGESGNSNDASATVIVPQPAAPTGLTATAGNAQVSLTWNASSTATSYNVKRGSTTGSYTTISTVSGTSFTDTSLTNGTKYYYVVTAVNAGGESGNSNEVNATPIKPGPSFGDVQTISFNAPVPTGWVVIRLDNPYKDIKYVGGASFGQTVSGVLNTSPIPDGWVILTQDNTYKTIKCVIGASFGQTVAGVNILSPIPEGWVVLTQDSTYRTIECVIGAPYGRTVTGVNILSPIPTGWVILTQDNYYRTIECVIGASYGRTVTGVNILSPIPEGWVILTQDNYYRTIECVIGASYGRTLTVSSLSPIPTGWIVVSEDLNYKYIKYVG